MDMNRAALMKDFVTGVQLEGPFVRDHCISCIVGKSPQKSYPSHGNFLSRHLVVRNISSTFLMTSQTGGSLLVFV